MGSLSAVSAVTPAQQHNAACALNLHAEESVLVQVDLEDTAQSVDVVLEVF
jgi:hypothetical protein